MLDVPTNLVRANTMIHVSFQCIPNAFPLEKYSLKETYILVNATYCLKIYFNNVFVRET